MSDERVIAGRYRLLERLGSGGSGVVWRSFDERLRRTVAVKQVHVPGGLTGSQNDELVRRTMREGRIAARLHHPQLITVYDVVEDKGHPYLIMEHFPSKSLAALGTLASPSVARLGAEAAEALAAAHESGVVHRDVKPANVLVGTDSSVKITDFGISRVVEDLTATMTGMFAGTPAYLAPEVAKGGQATFASDVYSLGATLYAAVEGQPPTGNDNNPMGLLYRVASGEIIPPKRAGELTDLVLWLLSTDPGKRPTMTQANQALAAISRRNPAGPLVSGLANGTAASPAAEAKPATTPGKNTDSKPATAPGENASSKAATPGATLAAAMAGSTTEPTPPASAEPGSASASAATAASPTDSKPAAASPEADQPAEPTPASEPRSAQADSAGPAAASPSESDQAVSTQAGADEAGPASPSGSRQPAESTSPTESGQAGAAAAPHPAEPHLTQADSAAAPGQVDSHPSQADSAAAPSQAEPHPSQAGSAAASRQAESHSTQAGATDEPGPAAAAFTASASPSPTGPPPPTPSAKRRRIRAIAIGAGLLAVAVVAALLTVLINQDDTPAPNQAGGTTTSRTTTEEPAPTTENPTTTTTTTPKTTTPQPPPSTEQPPPQGGSATPAAAVSDYYALMPGNRDQAWNRLTPKFQTSPAGGKSGYDRFWSQISSVAASDVAQTGDNTVEVTLLYTYNDGHRVRERHRYTLVNQNGTWLIDAVKVLSSNPA